MTEPMSDIKRPRASRKSSKAAVAERRAAVAQARSRALHDALERLTPPRTATSSVTVKVSAQGQVMPDITITPDLTDEVLDRMIGQAVRALTDLVAAANGASS